MLIVTPAAFNRVTRLPVVVPVTSGGNFARTAGFAVSLDGVGIRTTGVVRCDQPRTIDMKARGGKTTRTGSGDYHERSSWPSVHYSDLNMGFEGQLDENVRFRALKPLLSHHSGDSQTLFG